MQRRPGQDSAARHTAAGLAVAALLTLGAGPAGAQDRAQSIGSALFGLAAQLNDYFSRNRDTLSRGQASISISEVTDSYARVSCQPLSRDLGSAFERALTERVKDSGLGLDFKLFQEMDENDVFVRLEYSARGPILTVSAKVGVFSSDNVRETATLSADADIDTLWEDTRACVERDDRSFGILYCTSPRDLRLLDAVDSLFGRPVATVRSGSEMAILGTYADGQAVVVELLEDDGGGTVRGFLPGSIDRMVATGRLECDGPLPGATAPDTPVVRRAFEVFRDCEDLCPEMAVLPLGMVYRGSEPHEAGRDADEPDLLGSSQPMDRPIAIGTGEVTVGEWAACVADRACAPRASPAAPAERPVAVSFDDAQAYADWLSERTGARYRLPTETEWIFAARGNLRSRYHWGDVMQADVAVCRNCLSYGAPDGPEPRGSRRPNDHKLHHMLGNLAEWVSDCWTGAADGGACSNRVIKGGSYRDDSLLLRVANRNYGAADAVSETVGFRLVRELD